MKTTFFTATTFAAVLMTAVSCQEVVLEDKTDGAISVQLKNSPKVELVTKTDDADDDSASEGQTGSDGTTDVKVDTDGFNVYINDGSETEVYIYKDIKDKVMPVTPGTYTISADNVTEEKSRTNNGNWGEVRYATPAPVEKVVSAGVATAYALECKMTNAAVSVRFEGDFDAVLSEYSVTVYMKDAEDRKLKYDKTNTSDEGLKSGYFTPTGSKLRYDFNGKPKAGTELNLAGEFDIDAATHLILKFKLKDDPNGYIQPEISVNTECVEVPKEVEIDPTQSSNGSSDSTTI